MAVNYTPQHPTGDNSKKRFLEEVYVQLAQSLPKYAKHCLKISDKGGKEIPFTLNKAQLYLHNRIEEQKRRTGKVRVLILKGRQQGCSTYVAARFYHKAVFHKGQSIYILSHESSTTQKLFDIVKRYHDNVPEQIRMKVEKDNEKSYEFVNKSRYSVGTARNKNTGRGGTVQLFHGSEVAFFENTDELQTGLLQSISDMPGTEVILESTANGLGNFFHQACYSAMHKQGEFELIFIPWFWQEEYYKTPPSDFAMTEEEGKLHEQFGLNPGQLYWRRLKIADLGTGGEWKFQQEYPNTPQEAFISSGESMIPAEKIVNARKRNLEIDLYQPMILGVDPSRKRDRFVIVPRRGRKMHAPMVIDPKIHGEITTQQGAGFILEAIRKYQPEKVFIDSTKDHGIYDFLVNMGYGKLVTAVAFSEGALRKDLYLNKRVEMLMSIGDWFDQEEVDIPDDDAVHSDIAAIPRPRQNTLQKWFIEDKETIKTKYKLSTDIADALGLTFAFPVRYTKGIENQVIQKTNITKKGRTLSTYDRVSGSTKTGTIKKW